MLYVGEVTKIIVLYIQILDFCKKEEQGKGNTNISIFAQRRIYVLNCVDHYCYLR